METDEDRERERQRDRDRYERKIKSRYSAVYERAEKMMKRDRDR